MRRRTDFEYLLRRRQQSCADYNKYLSYELNLDDLLKVRCNQASMGSSKEKKDQIRKLQASNVRHICYVYERSLRRFAGNIDLWNDYIYFLKTKGATNILNAVFGRALSLHPKNEDLWIQAAVFEVEVNSNVHACRVLLQRALRVNRASEVLWMRYFQLELWSTLRLLERKRVLGVTDTDSIESDNASTVAAPSFNPKLAVPLVVYRHAVSAIPSLDFAQLLLASCPQTPALLDLRKQIEGNIQERFGHTYVYWESRVTRQVGDLLREVREVTGEDWVDMLCRCVDDYVSMHADARRGMGDTPVPLKYLSIAQSILDAAMEKVWSSPGGGAGVGGVGDAVRRLDVFLQEVSGLQNIEDAIGSDMLSGGMVILVVHKLWLVKCALRLLGEPIEDFFKCDVADVSRWLNEYRARLDQKTPKELEMWIDVAAMGWATASHLLAYSEACRSIPAAVADIWEVGSVDCLKPLGDAILSEYRNVLRVDVYADDGADCKGSELLWTVLRSQLLSPGAGEPLARKWQVAKLCFQNILSVPVCRHEHRVEWNVRYLRFAAQESFASFKTAVDFIADLRGRMPMVYANVDMTSYHLEVLSITMSYMRDLSQMNAATRSAVSAQLDWAQKIINSMLKYCEGRERSAALAVECKAASTVIGMWRANNFGGSQSVAIGSNLVTC